MLHRRFRRRLWAAGSEKRLSTIASCGVAARAGAGSTGAEGAALIESESLRWAVLPMYLAKYSVLQRQEMLRGEWSLVTV